MGAEIELHLGTGRSIYLKDMDFWRIQARAVWLEMRKARPVREAVAAKMALETTRAPGDAVAGRPILFPGKGHRSPRHWSLR